MSLAHEVDELTMHLLHLLVTPPMRETTSSPASPADALPLSASGEQRIQNRSLAPNSSRSVGRDRQEGGKTDVSHSPLASVLKNLQRLSESERVISAPNDNYEDDEATKRQEDTTVVLSSATPSATPTKKVRGGAAVGHYRYQPTYATTSHFVSRPPLSSSTPDTPTGGDRSYTTTHNTTTVTSPESNCSPATTTDDDDGKGQSPRSSAVGMWHAKQLIDELRRVEARTAALLDKQAADHETATEHMRAQLAQQQQQIFALQQDKFDLQQELFVANGKRSTTTEVLQQASLQLSELERAQQDELDSWRRQVRELRSQLARSRFEKDKAEKDLQNLSQQFAAVSGELARSKARVAVLRDHANLVAVRSKQKDEELRDVAVFVKQALLPFVEESDKLKRMPKTA
jgi:hypothetical protein